MYIHLHKECMPNFLFRGTLQKWVLETFYFRNYHLINFRHCVMLARKNSYKVQKLLRLDVV